MDTGDQLLILARLLLAALLGAFIGIERELRGYPAGVRTVALVTAGSALFTEVSRIMGGGEDRIAAGVVTGIGFLGAGLIFREGYTVRGITTAATVWSAAAIGMAVGRELYLAAGLGALIVFVLLESKPVVRRLEALIRLLGKELVLREEDQEDRHHEEHHSG